MMELQVEEKLKNGEPYVIRQNIPVYQHAKYVKAREKAIELINKKDYGLSVWTTLTLKIIYY